MLFAPVSFNSVWMKCFCKIFLDKFSKWNVVKNKILLFYKIKVMFKSWRRFSKLCVLYVKCISTYTLTFLAQISQNGQIHSTNSPANCRWIIRVCLTICLGLTLKRFNVTFKFLSCRWQKSRRLTLNFGKVENSNNCCYQLLHTCLEIM